MGLYAEIVILDRKYLLNVNITRQCACRNMNSWKEFKNEFKHLFEMKIVNKKNIDTMTKALLLPTIPPMLMISIQMLILKIFKTKKNNINLVAISAKLDIQYKQDKVTQYRLLITQLLGIITLNLSEFIKQLVEWGISKFVYPHVMCVQ